MSTNPDRDWNALRAAVEYRSRIWAYIHALVRDPETAEDLFQEVYVVICQKQEEFRHGTNFIAWARAIARNIVLQHFERAGRALRPTEPEVIEQALAVAEAEAPGSDEHVREALRTCLDTLPERIAAAIRSHYYEGRQCSEIAGALQVQVAGVYTILSRARRTLAECIERRLQAESSGS